MHNNQLDCSLSHWRRQLAHLMTLIVVVCLLAKLSLAKLELAESLTSAGIIFHLSSCSHDDTTATDACGSMWLLLSIWLALELDDGQQRSRLALHEVNSSRASEAPQTRKVSSSRNLIGHVLTPQVVANELTWKSPLPPPPPQQQQ